MLLDFFIAYPYVVYSIIVWGFIFVVIRIKGLIRLWPVSILSGFLLFIAIYWLVKVGLYKISIEFLPVLGIPFFLILWGAGSGIVYANYLGEKNYQRVLAILGFSAITLTFERIVESYKRVEHLAGFNDVYEYIFDIFILSTLAFLLTNFFEHRLKKE